MLLHYPEEARTMKTTLSATAVLIWLATGMLPAHAQPAALQSADSVSPHHQVIYRMMKDMTGEMALLTEQMSRGELRPDDRKKMAERLAVMGRLMRRLSGLAARPALKHADLQKQVDQMRKQMIELGGNSGQR
jgi:hypothetical protein